MTKKTNNALGVVDEASYHPCTSILIEGLKRLEGGSDVLAEWDRARAKADTALAKQPAAVDEAMVERACRHWYSRWDEADQATKMLWAEMMYDLLAAALAPPPADPEPQSSRPSSRHSDASERR